MSRDGCFVKTTISDLGYAEYSEYFIGHSGYTYWPKMGQLLLYSIWPCHKYYQTPNY